MESYSGFYPSRPYWAGSKVDFSVPRVEGWFHDQMSEIVYATSIPDRLSLKISRDGKILIRLNELEPPEGGEIIQPVGVLVKLWGTYLDYLNCFYLLLDSAVTEIDNFALFNLHEITTRDAFRETFDGDRSMGMAISVESIVSVFQMGRFLGTYNPAIPIEYDPKIMARNLVSLEAISVAVERFLVVVSSPGAEKHLASYAKSISEFKVGNYETAIILSWFIVESIANDLWSLHLDSLNRKFEGGKYRINRARKDVLTGRDFTASITINVLELFGVLETDTFEAIDKVRGYRNKIVHSDGYSPGAGETNQALEVARKMMFRKWNISFTPNLSFSVPGM